MEMNNRAFWITLIVVFFIAGAVGSYFFMKYIAPARQASEQSSSSPAATGLDQMTIRIFAPSGGRIVTSERSVQRKSGSIALAESVIEEFFKSAGPSSSLPQNVKLLGAYRDSRQMLYIDLSEEARKNFQGDALAEYLMLKSLYESLSSNLQDFQDLKVLVEGKEIETLGGHFFLKYPLKNMVLYEIKTESKSSNE